MVSRARLLAVSLCALVVGAGLSEAADAGGAPTIAAAPLIAVGQAQVNAVAGIDYWRVRLREGDHLMLQYAPQKEFSWVEVCLYRPGVTDGTVASQRCYAGGQTLNHGSLTISARP